MLFNPEINSIEEDILYHETQIKEAQERLDQVKVSQAYSDAVISSLQDFLDNTDPFLYEVLKGHVEQMFDENKVVPNNDLSKIEEQEDEIEYLEFGDPNYKSIEQLQQEDPDTVVAVFHSEEHLESKGITSATKEVKKEFDTLSYYELTGRPDLRPTKYEDLAPNISYSSDGRAYVGFNDKDEAEEFRDAISEPSLIDDAVIMNGFKFEVKFHCSKQCIQEIADSVNSMSDDPVDNFEEINSRVIYNHNDQTVYLGMTAKNRCDYYGQYLTGQLTVGEKYTYSDKPSFINGEEYRYELRITEIELDDAVHLASFNLQRDPEHPDNAKLLTDWRANKIRKVEPAYTPLPKAIALEDVKLGDIVTTDATKVKDKQYKVLAHKELEGVTHVEAICIFNKEMPALVNQCSWFKEVYPVEPGDICIAPQFCDREREEVLTEDVQIYVPKEKLSTTKSKVLSENDFPLYPYDSIKLTELEFGDIITSTSYARSAYEVIAVNQEYATAICLYHKSLPLRKGEEYTFANPYLVEKALSGTKEAELIEDCLTDAEPIPA